MKNKNRPLIGITIGDPGGIGPEVCIKALCHKTIYTMCRPMVIGDAKIIKDAVKFCHLDLAVKSCSTPKEGSFSFGTIDVLDLNNMPLDQLQHKMITPQQGQASFEYVIKAIELAIAGKIDGTVTGPISKEAINAAVTEVKN